MMLGGFGNAKPVDDKVASIAHQVRPHVESQLGAFETFEPHSYKTQVVAGTNYLIKIHVGSGKYVHAKVHQPLPCNGSDLSLMEASGGHTLETNL